MVLQLIYFSISFLNNFFGSNALDRDNSTTLQKIRDFIFATLGFPIGQFVGIVFWTLFYIDRELVFPEVLDKLFPNYINHMMHTTVIPAQLLELILLYHIYPSRLKGMATSYLFCLDNDCSICWRHLGLSYLKNIRSSTKSRIHVYLFIIWSLPLFMRRRFK